MTYTADSAGAKSEKAALTNAIIIITVGIFATYLPQTLGLARLPIQNLLKNELHVDRTANAAFFFWSGLAWYFKPLAGIFTDAFPLFGSRRRNYILVSITLGTASWIGLYFTPHAYNPLLWVCILINLFMVVASCVVGGYLVETAQAMAGSGRLTAAREIVQQICLIIRGPGAGYLASIAFGWTAGICGGLMFVLVPVTVIFLHERRTRISSRQVLSNAGQQLRNVATAGTLWGAAGLTALFYIAPGFSTALFYKQQNDLHMNTQGQGFLQLLGGVFGLVAAVGYGFACRRYNLRTLLMGCLLAGTIANLAYLFYVSVPAAEVIESLNGFGFTLAELALMDLAVRATPVGSEGMGYSLMLSVRNLALFGTDWLGSALLDTFHLKFSTLVLANSAMTVITVPLVLLLPRALVRHRDAELYEEAGAPRMGVQD